LGLFQLSIRKSQQIETKGVLSEVAFAKAKAALGRDGEARIEVLPAASSYQLNRYLEMPISFSEFTEDCHRVVISRTLATAEQIKKRLSS
jgi:hypothetical protein